MTESRGDAPAPQALEIYDDHPVGLVCRVCGVLVPREGGYSRAHWDWHEASNGA